jgi:hypothetical protein
MKVWVIWNEDKHITIDGIFSTEKKALDYIESFINENKSEKNIEEFELDHLLKSK